MTVTVTYNDDPEIVLGGGGGGGGNHYPPPSAPAATDTSIIVNGQSSSTVLNNTGSNSSNHTDKELSMHDGNSSSSTQTCSLPRESERSWFYIGFTSLLASIVLFIAMIWVDSISWKFPLGLLGGGVVFIFIAYSPGTTQRGSGRHHHDNDDDSGHNNGGFSWLGGGDGGGE